MDKERLTNLKQTLQRNKEFTTLDVIEQLEKENKITEEILIGNQYEINRLEVINKRAKILLKATLDLLQKQKDSHYVLNLLETTSFYDEAECDGYCLFDDIENFLNFGS